MLYHRHTGFIALLCLVAQRKGMVIFMKVLYITTVGLTMGFFKLFIKELLDEGHTVDIATNECDYPVADCYREWGCKIYPISCSRSPFKSGNLRAIKEIKRIVSNGGYEIVHCHTPIAAACTRLACKSLRKKGVKVIYTAHGFHFYKGAPKKNWILYYPIEKICAKWTDLLITINKEDYEFANRRIHAKKVEYVPGVGIEMDKFANTTVDKIKKRQEIGVPENAFMLLSVGELNENKNHQIVIKALAEVNDPSIHYVIAGKGDKADELNILAKEMQVHLHLLGYRTDVAELYKVADAFVLPSFREGLNVSVMEALASGLPCLVSRIRGNVDMVNENVNGYYLDPFDIFSVADSIKKTGRTDKNRVVESALIFDVKEINQKMMTLYHGVRE